MELQNPEARKKFVETLKKAEQLFGKMPEVKLYFSNIGKAAGLAKRVDGKYSVTLNVFALEQNPTDCIENTIPHEVAHIVCYAYPNLGRNHNPGWKRVCRMLGGNGTRCYTSEQYQLAPKRKTTNHKYNVNGKELVIGAIQHNRIQTRSKRYSFRGTEVRPEHYVGVCQ